MQIQTIMLNLEQCPAFELPRERRLEPALRQAIVKRARRYGILLVVALAVRIFLFETSVVPTGSMEGTILVGDHIVLNKSVYGPAIPFTSWRLPQLRTPERGEIVAFDAPHKPGLSYIKRVVAVGGDRVEIRGGIVHLNGVAMREPYAQHKYLRTVLHENMREVVVPPEHLFVMGDNRDNSLDSRDWGFVPVRNVIGEPLFVYWSYDAPSSAWLDSNFFRKLRLYASAMVDVRHTRWSRTGTVL